MYVYSPAPSASTSVGSSNIAALQPLPSPSLKPMVSPALSKASKAKSLASSKNKTPSSSTFKSTPGGAIKGAPPPPPPNPQDSDPNYANMFPLNSMVEGYFKLGKEWKMAKVIARSSKIFEDKLGILLLFSHTSSMFISMYILRV